MPMAMRTELTDPPETDSVVDDDSSIYAPLMIGKRYIELGELRGLAKGKGLYTLIRVRPDNGMPGASTMSGRYTPKCKGTVL